MKHKVAELEGPALDVAVAIADGRTWSKHRNPDSLGGAVWLTVVDTEMADQPHVPYAPSRSWCDGGPIIERERIKLHPPETRRPGVNWEWQADCYGPIDSPGEYFHTEEGETPLFAAMRAYVLSKLGEEVDLP